MRPFASTPAARTKDTEIWSINGQNCSFYNLNRINVRRSQKNGPMLFFIQNNFYTCKYDRLFQSVKKIRNRENILSVRHVKHAAHGPHVVCGPHDNTNETHMAIGGPSVWHAWSTTCSYNKFAQHCYTQYCSFLPSFQFWKVITVIIHITIHLYTWTNKNIMSYGV
jgi:hypothetical protein